MYRDTKAIFDELDIDIDPRARVGTFIRLSNADDRNCQRFPMMRKSSSWTNRHRH